MSDRLSVLRHWPERIVAVTDGEDSPAALIEYRRLEPGEQAEPSDVEYVRADLLARAVEALKRIASRDSYAPGDCPDVARTTMANLDIPYSDPAGAVDDRPR